MRHSPTRRPTFCLLLVIIVGAAMSGCAAGGARVSTSPPADPPRVDLVIQGAVDSEVTPLVQALSGATRIQLASWTFWRGRLAGRDVVVSRTEVGPINAAAATTLAILTFHPRLILNQGTAGATDPTLHVFDIVVGEATVDYGGFRTGHLNAGEGSNQANWTRMPHRLRFEGADERMTLPVFPGDPDAMAVALAQPYSQGKVVKGVIGSAFQFNQEVDRLLWIRQKYDAVSEDMESAFAAGAALGFNTPFLAVRIVSDSDFYAPGIHPDAAGLCARFVLGLAAALPALPARAPLLQ